MTCPDCERLRKLLAEVMQWIDGWDPNFIQDDDWPDVDKRIHQALAGDGNEDN